MLLSKWRQNYNTWNVYSQKHAFNIMNWQQAYRAHRFEIGLIASTQVAARNVAVPMCCAVAFTSGP